MDCELKKGPELELSYHCNHRARRAEESFYYGPMTRSWEAERNDLSNCQRVISDHQLSYLRVFHADDLNSLDVVLICSHAISDGVSMAICMNDYLSLLADKQPLTSREMTLAETISRLPSASEAQLPIRQRTAKEFWQIAIAYTIHEIRERKSKVRIEGFDWNDINPITSQQVFEFPRDLTQQLVVACRRQKCTIGHLIYAASTAAFTDVAEVVRPGAQVSIGTPTNARRLFREPCRSRRDEMVVALSFLNFELPCIRISDASDRNVKRLWSLARLAKSRVHGQFADHLFPYYSYISQEKRVALGPSIGIHSKSINPTGRKGTATLSFGSSSIGPMEHYLSLPENEAIELADISIGMRARSGESLMHSYSFKGRLRLSLVYDDQLGGEKMRRWLERTGEVMKMVVNTESARL